MICSWRRNWKQKGNSHTSTIFLNFISPKFCPRIGFDFFKREHVQVFYQTIRCFAFLIAVGKLEKKILKKNLKKNVKIFILLYLEEFKSEWNFMEQTTNIFIEKSKKKKFIVMYLLHKSRCCESITDDRGIQRQV